MPKSNAELGAEIERLNDIVRRLGLDGEIPARTILQSNGLGGAKWYEYLYLPGNFVLAKDSGGSWRLGVDAAFFIQAGGGSVPKVQIGGSGAKETGTDVWIDDSGNLTAANVLSGTFTPTVTLGANAAVVTVSVAHYLRVGSVVSVFGRCECDPTLAATLTIFTLSLPIASNFGGIEQLAGGFWSGGTTTGNTGEIKGEATADTAQFAITPVGAAQVAYYYSYGYRVI